MKKLLSLLFVFTLVACGGSDSEDSDNFFNNHREKVWVNDTDLYYRFEGSGEDGTIFWRAFNADESPNCVTYQVGDNIETGNCYNNKVIITSNSANRLEVTTQFFEGRVENGECVDLIDVNNVGPRLVSITVNGNQLTISAGDDIETWNLVEENIPDCFL